MSDDVDKAQEKSEPLIEAGIREIQRKARTQVVSWAGECDECGDEHPRLVKWVCPRCRDKLGLP